jgi:H/ACA ribonucleoprotein complex subunit 4|tara:strand:- start:410 stop:1387 length:978 start_codon:yes stop_codon:yes gene_type:complete
MGKLPFEYIYRNVLVRKDSVTDPNYGCKPEERDVRSLIDYGIVNIDKSGGPTSHQVSDYVQKILGIDKSGHSGTLDPNVTGVLPIALGRATRVVQTLLTAGKEYICLMHLHKEVKEKKLKLVMKKFVGKIMQLPPVKSAVKRVEREREIYYIEILEIDGQDVLFKIGCQAGTYIRKICYDIGKKLKVGAHMAELRRTKAGPFDESTLFILQDLADAYHFYKEGNEKYIRKVVQPMENAVKHLPRVWVLDTTVNSLCHGVDLKVPGISKVEDQIEEKDRVAVMTLKGELICLGNAKMSSNEMLKDKGVAVKTEKVFMSDDSYKVKT